MNPFVIHSGIAAPLMRSNIDTDAIIPSREMKLVSKKGLGEGLFAGWRYTEPGGRTLNPNFVLNQPAYSGCSILLAGKNFGCGSSREHAVWALAEFGIRAIIAPSFGVIFYNNCVRNGILPIVVDESTVTNLAQQVKESDAPTELTIDLSQQVLLSPSGEKIGFDIETAARQMLLEGLDPIDLTLKLKGSIDEFQRQRHEQQPWLGS